jgi:hypothetical protein
MPRCRQPSPPPKRCSLVEGLVERVGCVSDLLQRRRRGGHGIGPLAQACHRIVWLLPVLCITGLVRIHPRIGAVDPHLGKIPHRGFDRRPQLFLIGRELDTGMDRGNPCVGKGRPVFRAHSHMVVRPRTVLGIDHGRPGNSERRDAGEKDLLHANLLLRRRQNERAFPRNQLTVWQDYPLLRRCNLPSLIKMFQIMPSIRGSHSEISGI